ncbi:glycerol-3-phosphate 1-O-acyltransferase PlsY [Candidatus Pelagibacter bacterium]|nr:glycerol-3-phosphate 1-O-acyltransferase PlsY [Candidatus Pelagibacter bacterium]MDA9624825.1 glycerol-3-phosphate 1-O-acyltransferase PlsY [Candidatus Pelagibacter bacterium]
MDILIVLFYSYFLGSIPFGFVVTKFFLKEDIRNIGSGNIGTTNVLRTGEKSLAVATLLLDVLKGYASVIITTILFDNLIFFSSLICFIGHIFPIWLKFKGGKGVAVYLGIIIALSYPLGIVFCLTWIFIAFIFKYSSLSSMSGTLTVLFYSITLNDYLLSFFLFTIFIIILFTHRENIRKLKNSEETKIKL